jgi:phage terminase large subunit-like protein
VLENLIATGKIRHGGNKVLHWMIGNAAVREDSNNNIKPLKPKPGSPERIDGVISLVMALGVHLNKPADLNPDIFFL